VPDTHRGRAGLVAAALAATYVVLLTLVATDFEPLLSLDEHVVDSWHGAVDGTGWESFFQGLADISTPWVVRTILLVVAVVLLIRRRTLEAAWIALTLALSGTAWWATKNLVQRERPDVPEQIGGYSFPSGHATEIATTMGLLVVITWRALRPGRGRNAVVTLWVLIAVLVGLDRVLLGVHNPSDVVGGWSLGAFLVVLTTTLLGLVTTRMAARPLRPLSTMPEDRRTLAVVLNPIKVPDADAFKTRVAEASRNAGWDEPLWFETTVDDAGASMARAAVAAGADVVVAAGGDGTVRVVCAEMAGTGIPVGIVPAGTGNLLARNLGIPLGHFQALEAVFRGQDRAIDVVAIDGDNLDPTRFMVMAGLGLDAAIMAGAPDSLKARMGWSAYFVAGLKHLRYPAVRVDIAVDDAEPVRRRARTVVVGNVGSLTAGIPLLPDARIDDGLLDVVVIAPRRFLGWFGLLWRVLTKHPRTDERLDRFTGKSVTITAAHSAPRQLDGDTVGSGTEIRARIEPGLLLVRVPR